MKSCNNSNNRFSNVSKLRYLTSTFSVLHRIPGTHFGVGRSYEGASCTLLKFINCCVVHNFPELSGRVRRCFTCGVWAAISRHMAIWRQGRAAPQKHSSTLGIQGSFHVDIRLQTVLIFPPRVIVVPLDTSYLGPGCLKKCLKDLF